MLDKHHFMVVLHDYTDPEALNRRLSVRDKHLAGALKAENEGNLLVGGAILDNHEVNIIQFHLHKEKFTK